MPRVRVLQPRRGRSGPSARLRRGLRRGAWSATAAARRSGHRQPWLRLQRREAEPGLSPAVVGAGEAFGGDAGGCGPRSRRSRRRSPARSDSPSGCSNARGLHRLGIGGTAPHRAWLLRGPGRRRGLIRTGPERSMIGGWARWPVRRAWATTVRRRRTASRRSTGVLEAGDGVRRSAAPGRRPGEAVDGGATVRSLWQYRHLIASSWISSAQ